MLCPHYYFICNITLIARGEYGPYESYNSKFHGIGQYDEEKHTKRVHAYYQWVPFVLFTTVSTFSVVLLRSTTMGMNGVENVVKNNICNNAHNNLK